MAKMLSEQLREVAFIEVDNPIRYFDELAELAKELELNNNVLSIVRKELGGAVVDNALETYLKRSLPIENS